MGLRAWGEETSEDLPQASHLGVQFSRPQVTALSVCTVPIPNAHVAYLV